ncbi:MAG: hypothetical protein KGJ13_02305 [Patescibacteria group bacterium]|nr:hypothetical protein [Patescibacteria group bacterium]
MTSVLAVDPGVHGAVAVLAESGLPVFLEPFRPHMTAEEGVHLLERAHKMAGQNSIALIEKVGVMPGDGRQGAFTFGRIAGGIEWALLALGARICHVYPAVWQSSLGCLSGGNKNVTKRKAQELFSGMLPEGCSITHATADALLIAHYGLEKLGVLLP